MNNNHSRKCVLHIGITKTGSTTIQEFLFNHLDDERFHYAHCGARNSGQALYHAFDRHASSIDKYKVRRYTEEQLLEKQEANRKMFREHIEGNPDKTIIISAEALSTFNPDGLKEFIDFLRPYFDNIQVVGYVRDPRTHMESAFQQRLKRTSMKKLKVIQFSPKYQDILEKYERLVGRKNMRIWRFDQKTFPDGDVVFHFCEQLGIRPPAQRVASLNQRLSDNAISLFYTMRYRYRAPETGPRARKSATLLKEKLWQLEGKRLRFHPDLYYPAVQANKDQIDWLKEHFGIDFHQDPNALEESGVKSKRQIMTYSDETLEWWAGELGGKRYLKLFPLTPAVLLKAIVNFFTRSLRPATRGNIAVDVRRLKESLVAEED